MGRHEQGGERYEFLRGSAGDFEEVSLHVYLVFGHDDCDGCAGWGWACGGAGALRLAD